MSAASNDQRDNPYSYDGAAAPARSGILPDDTVYWLPTDGATLHNGKRIPARMEFPFLPPAELGEVYTASSELRGAMFASFWYDLRTMAGRIAAAIFIALYIGFQFAQFATAIIQTASMFGVVMMIVCVVMLLFEFLRRKSREKYTKSKSMSSKILRPPECSFVCELGFVQWFRNSEGYRAEVETFDRFTQLIYQGQELNKMATEAIEAVLVNPRGEHLICLLNSNLQPVIDHFEFSVQIAWTKFLLRRVRASIQSSGYYDFPMRNNLVFRFWANHIEIIEDRRTIRVTKSDVVLFRFTFDQKIKFFIRGHLSPTNRGEFAMHLFEIPNVSAFCTVIETVFGTKMEGKKVDFLPKWHHGGW